MDIKNKLKEALCNNDVNYLEKNKSSYFIDERFEDENNDTLLLYSISDEQSTIYNYLLKNNANTNLINDEGEGIIHAIVFSGDIIRLKEIVNNYNIDINHQANDGSTPLLLAVSLNRNDIAEVLVNYGADVNIADFENMTPLHLAAQSDSLKLVEFLLKYGADTSRKTKNGNLALALAVNYGNIEIIQSLFKTMYSSIG